jgi:hypothetical protein
MNIGKYSIFFFLSMVKFLFTPFGGPAAKLTFMETYLSCVAGGVFSAFIFFFMSDFFMKKAVLKRREQYQAALKNGAVIPFKKKFTFMNKLVVRMKMKIGIFGVAMYAPLFLSVPLGSIITAKFYGKEKKTFPLIVLGMFINGLITSSLAYFAGSLF